MLNFALALLLTGAAFLLIEAFIPGFGVFGALGLVLLAVSSFIIFRYVPFGPYIVLCEIGVFAVISFLIFRYAKNKQLGGKLILRDTLTSRSGDNAGLDGYIGKEGITKTALKPYGTVDFNGVSVSVCADGAYIAEHKRVKVVRIERKTIFVAPFNQN